MPAGGHARIDLPLQADNPLTVSGDGSITLSGGLSAPAVKVEGGILHLDCDARTNRLKLKSTSLALGSKHVIDGELGLDTGVHLSIDLEKPPTRKALILEADRITGKFETISFTVKGRGYRTIVQGGRVFVSP